jgi:hypothetical protein
MLSPEQCAQQLEALAAQYKRVCIFKFFNTCCDKCLAKPPVFLVVADLDYEDVVMAHGLSLQAIQTQIQRIHRIFADKETASVLA